MLLNQDFKDLLVGFDEGDVRYLLIGGYAVTFHAQPRFTKDIDLWIDDSHDNVERTCAALAAFGASDIVVEGLRNLAADEILYMGAPPTRVDIFKTIPGAYFPSAYENRIEALWDGVPVSIISREDLIAAKEAAGRPIDIEDVRNLRK